MSSVIFPFGVVEVRRIESIWIGLPALFPLFPNRGRGDEFWEFLNGLFDESVERLIREVSSKVAYSGKVMVVYPGVMRTARRTCAFSP